MSFIDTFKAFFKAQKVDPATIAVHDALCATIDAVDAAFHAAEPYSTCANHRHAILYDEMAADYTDPADLDAWTEAYLDAHTAAMRTATAAFEMFAIAFAAVDPTDDLYTAAAALYKAYSDTYTFTASAYLHAAICSMTVALAGNCRAAKNAIVALRLEARADRATDPAAADAVAAKANAAAFRARVVEDSNKYKRLEQKARIAETSAEVYLANAKSAAATAANRLEPN